mmetsp:Transcript_15593/g.18532  ORF Transcript_15593/g.18532 Transcript_15593/m.18532 type:complete len:82 (-) Transcript_15593:422-667(-)
MIILLQWWKPLEDAYSNYMETFNECTMLVLLYIMMLFSDFVPDAEMRSVMGIVYIAIVCTFGGVHLSIMLGFMCWNFNKRY